MDSTLIEQECIDEMARFANKYDDVARITERAMNGELDFSQSLAARVALLEGLNAEKLFACVIAKITFSPGAMQLCQKLRSLGIKLAVLSGGFVPMAEYVKTQLGLDYAFANTLEVDPNTGNLTGRIAPGYPIVDASRKASLVNSIAAKLELIPSKNAMAVGDGANDLLMMQEVRLGVAVHAKPRVQQLAPLKLNIGGLRSVAFILGLSET